MSLSENIKQVGSFVSKGGVFSDDLAVNESEQILSKKEQRKMKQKVSKFPRLSVDEANDDKEEDSMEDPFLDAESVQQQEYHDPNRAEAFLQDLQLQMDASKKQVFDEMMTDVRNEVNQERKEAGLDPLDESDIAYRTGGTKAMEKVQKMFPPGEPTAYQGDQGGKKAKEGEEIIDFPESRKAIAKKAWEDAGITGTMLDMIADKVYTRLDHVLGFSQEEGKLMELVNIKVSSTITKMLRETTDVLQSVQRTLQELSADADARKREHRVQMAMIAGKVDEINIMHANYSSEIASMMEKMSAKLERARKAADEDGSSTYDSLSNTGPIMESITNLKGKATDEAVRVQTSTQQVAPTQTRRRGARKPIGLNR